MKNKISIKFYKVIALIFFVSSIGYSKTSIALDLTYTRYTNFWYIVFENSSWENEVFLDKYYGITGNFNISLIKNLDFRIELIKVIKYDFSGGVEIGLFSKPGIDIIYNIPLHWKITPSVFGGVQYIRNINFPTNDKRGEANPCKIDGGLGLKYSIQKNGLFLQKFNYTKIMCQMPGEHLLQTC